MLVEDVMQTDIVTCDHEGTLRDAVGEMLRNRVGSVIVTEDGNPAGIVTETDALMAGYEAQRPFDDIDITAVVSHPLITTTGDATIRNAVNRMKDDDIKKLPVVEGMELVGIVTRTDIMGNYSDFVREAHELDQQRDRWEATRADIDEF